MSRRTSAVLIAVVAMMLGACTQQEPAISVQEQVPASARTEAPAEGGDAEGDGAVEGEPSVWVAVDVDFEAFDAELPADTPIALTLDNSGANLPHDITIEELGDNTVVTGAGGEVVSQTITLEAGTYTFYCSVPGHRGTMEETVTVS